MTPVISKDRILLGVPIKSKLDALERLSQIALHCKVTSNAQAYLSDLLHRESQFSTNLGQGIAIPHCRSSYVEFPSVIILKTIAPISWDDDCQDLVQFIMNLAVPEKSKSTVHLTILSQIARKLSDGEFVKNLLELDTVVKIYETFSILNLIGAE